MYIYIYIYICTYIQIRNTNPQCFKGGPGRAGSRSRAGRPAQEQVTIIVTCSKQVM